MMWAVAASISSLKYKEESFAHYSMYRAVKEQHQHLIEKYNINEKRELTHSSYIIPLYSNYL